MGQMGVYHVCRRTTRPPQKFCHFIRLLKYTNHLLSFNFSYFFSRAKDIKMRINTRSFNYKKIKINTSNTNFEKGKSPTNRSNYGDVTQFTVCL